MDIEQLEKDVRATFDLFDKNKDKSLSASELKSSLRSLGFNLTYQEVQVALKKIDTNGNGKIEFKEFRDFIVSQAKQSSNDKERQVRQQFAMFDRDGNGVIDKQELKRALRNLGEKMTDDEIKEMIAEADENSDGLIDYEEFVVLVTQKLSN